jgi:hypothetical protein
MESENSGNENNVLVDILVALGYLFAIGVNVYMIADQITDGESSRQLSLWWTRKTASLRHAERVDKMFRQQVGAVIFEAIETVEGA